MFDTIALQMGEVDRLLGHLDQAFVTPEDILAALFREYAKHGLIAQQSNYGRTSKLTTEFALGSRDSLLTQATDMMLPSYLEIKRNSQPLDMWRWVPAVDSAALEEARGLGQARVCFERYDDGFHIRLSFEPDNITFRLRYYSDPVIPASKNDAPPIAERFSPMIVSGAIKHVVSTAMSRSASYEDEKDQLTTAQLQALSGALSLAESEYDTWKMMYDIEVKSNRNPIGRDRRPILSRGMGSRRTYNG